MCGIAGFIDFTKLSNTDTLIKMTDALLHRGPDSSGYETLEVGNALVGLGHRRLSIIDLSPSGHQPMKYNNYMIVFNGEIYNYQEIKERLTALGYVFSSTSDTEVILKAFDKWGTDAVHQFNGMFAFTLVDQANNKVYIFRDRAGVKPLFYYHHNGALLFASELKSFHEHPVFQKEIDTDALVLFLKYGYIPAPHCIFNNTFKLKQGHFLEIDCNTNDVKEIKYWDVYDSYNKPKLKISEEEAIEETEKLLTSSFNYRMVSDVPVGVFLSGGYDSSAVAALIQKEQKQRLKTFTIGFEDAKFNEAIYAKKVAKYLGTEHHEYYCTTKEAQEIIPDLPFFYDEPFADSSAIPTILVSKHARKEVTVALSADGGDETFAGYGKHISILKNLKKYKKIPRIIQPALGQVMKLVSPKPFLFLGKDKRYRFERNYYNLSEAFKHKISVGSLLKHSNHRLDDKALNEVLKVPFKELKNYFDSENNLNNYNDALNTLIAIDYKTYMADDILAKVDRAGMSVSLEGREPLLDYRIIEFVAQLPSNLKINNNITKYTLKKIVHKFLPKELMERPKMGFGIPVIHWFRKELKSYFLEYLDKDFLQKQNIFDVEQILAMRTAYFEGKDDDFEFLWFVLMFQMWYKKWID